MVLTTMAGDDAVSAISALFNLGVERYLIADVLLAICCQRLVGTVCMECAGSDAPARNHLRRLGLNEAGTPAADFKRGRGCAACNQSG